MKIKEKIIVALDLETSDEAMDIVCKLDGHANFFKIGLGLLAKGGLELARELKQKTGKRKAIRKQKTDNKCLTCHLEFDGKECQQNCPVCGIIIHTDCLLGTEGCTNCENLNLK